MPAGWTIAVRVEAVRSPLLRGGRVIVPRRTLGPDALGVYRLTCHELGPLALQVVGMHPRYGVGAAGIVDLAGTFEADLASGEPLVLPLGQALVDRLCEVP